MASKTAPWRPACASLTDLINECPLLRSLLGAKRTCLFAPHMSAYDPKRTLACTRPLLTQSGCGRWPLTENRCSFNYSSAEYEGRHRWQRSGSCLAIISRIATAASFVPAWCRQPLLLPQSQRKVL